MPVALLKYWKEGVAILLLIASFLAGKTWESNHRDAILLKERNDAYAAYEAEAQRSQTLAKELEKLRAKRRSDAAASRSELDKVSAGNVVYSRDCIDDDGLRILNNSLTGSTGKQHDTMPAARAPEREDR